MPEGIVQTPLPPSPVPRSPMSPISQTPSITGAPARIPPPPGPNQPLPNPWFYLLWKTISMGMLSLGGLMDFEEELKMLELRCALSDEQFVQYLEKVRLFSEEELRYDSFWPRFNAIGHYFDCTWLSVDWVEVGARLLSSVFRSSLHAVGGKKLFGFLKTSIFLASFLLMRF